jgi:hypothetical protein
LFFYYIYNLTEEIIIHGIISDESMELIKKLPKFEFLSTSDDSPSIIFIAHHNVIYTVDPNGGCVKTNYNDSSISDFKKSTTEELEKYFSNTPFTPFDYIYFIVNQQQNKYQLNKEFTFKIKPGLYTFKLKNHDLKIIEYILVNINMDNTFNIYDNNSFCWKNYNNSIEYLINNLYTVVGFCHIFYHY